MYTYFTVATPDSLREVHSENQFLERFEIKVGGNFSLVTLNGLLSILDFRVGDSTERLNAAAPQDFQLYLFPESFTARLADCSDDQLGSISVRWAREYWECVEINSFDLFGFLLELKNLCQAPQPASGRMICAIAST